MSGNLVYCVLFGMIFMLSRGSKDTDNSEEIEDSEESEAEDSKLKKCMKNDIPYDENFWISHYKFKIDSFGFKSAHLYRGNYSDLTQTDDNYRYTSNVVILESGHIQPLRMFTRWKQLTYYQGNSATVHMIHCKTGEYKRIDLSSYTAKYLAIIESDYWYAVDVGKRLNVGYTVLGITMARQKTDLSPLVWGNRAELLSKFPQHRKIILKYTN